jgi:hypothetical protein
VLCGNEHVLDVFASRFFINPQQVVFRPLVETTRESLGTRAHLFSGCVFSVISYDCESFFNRLASYFMVDVDMPMDLGDGNQLESTGCGGGQCRSQRSGFVLRFMPSAHGMLKPSMKSTWVSMWWSFSVDL